MNILDIYPEIPLMRAGDPYILEIVRHEDAICDIENESLMETVDGRFYLDLSAADQELIRQIAADQLSYELETLFRWWNDRGAS